MMLCKVYQKDKLTERKFEILGLLEKQNSNLDNEEKVKLGKELNDIIIRLAKMK